MTAPRFLLVAFTWHGPIKVDELRPMFDTALDWIKFSADSWLLWTTSEPEIWMKYIKPHLGENDFVFIAELNLSATPMNYTGWNSQMLWAWIEKHRT